MIDFMSSAPWYLDHMLPVWHRLHPTERGVFFAPHRFWPQIHATDPEAKVLWPPRGRTRIVLVAGVKDLRRMRRLGRRIVYLSHGIGQWYGGSHSSYPGGRDRDGAVMFLSANDHAAAANRARYPEQRSLAIGTPKMDVWHTTPPEPMKPRPVVALSFHWDCHVAPESRSAFPHYETALQRLRQRYTVLGHSHPRAWLKMSAWYTAHGITPVENFDDVLAQADVYVCDNSSTLYEFASTDRPVVVLNAPWYRRDIEHGLRFWEYADVGYQVDMPSELGARIQAACEDPPEVQQRRRYISEQVFTSLDGKATDRAVDAIREVM